MSELRRYGPMIERNDEHGCYVLYDDFLKLQKQNDRLRQAYKCLEVLDRVIESSVCISLYKNESSHKAIKQALKEGAE